MLTDADLLGRYDRRVDVPRDPNACVWSSTHREEGVVTSRISERHVPVVTGVSGALEGQGQHAVGVRDDSILHILNGVFSRRAEALVICPPALAYYEYSLFNIQYSLASLRCLVDCVPICTVYFHILVLTARCTVLQSAVLRLQDVHLSVTLVGGSHRLEILETNCTDN